MKYELGDHSVVRCPENNLAADIEFKTKGWVGGTYNAIGGTIKNDKTGEVLFELSGLWTGEMFIRDAKTGQKKLLFDATNAKHAPPLARPIEEQGERESQRLWLSTVKAVHVVDHEQATVEKAKIEDRQREEAKRREESGEEWMPKLFRRVDSGPGGSEEGEADLEWIIKAQLYVFPPQDCQHFANEPRDASDPKKIINQILAIAPILPGQGAPNQQGAPSQTNPDASKNPSGAQAQPSAPSHANTSHGSNLIDLESRPSSTAPPETATKSDPIAGNPLHPTSDPQPTTGQQAVTQKIAPGGVTSSGGGSSSTNLMDHEDGMTHLSNQTSSLNLQKPLVPSGQAPLERADTESSDVDVFVDAEG